MISVTRLRAVLESYKTGYCCCPSLYGDLIKATIVSMHRSLMSMRHIAATSPACGQPVSADATGLRKLSMAAAASHARQTLWP